MKNYNLKSNTVAYTQQKLWLKTICFFLLISLFTQDAKSQYFEYYYGDNDTVETLTDGITTSDGHYFMTGYNATGKLVIIYADNMGYTMLPAVTAFPTTFPTTITQTFNTYNFKIIVTDNSLTNKIIVNAKCIEVSNQNFDFLIVCETSNGELIILAITDQAILQEDFPNPFTYSVSKTGPIYAITGENNIFYDANYKIALGNISLNSAGTHLYITGTARYQGTGLEKIFASQYNISSPSMVWANYYDIDPLSNIGDLGKDIIENNNGNADVIVIGHDAGNNQGFVLPLDNNGNTIYTPAPLFVPNARIYGYNNSLSEVFNSISVSNSTNYPGFVIGGTTNKYNLTTGTPSMLGVNITNTYGIGWGQYVIPNTPLIPVSNSGIVERQNSTGDYEYYLIGTTNNNMVTYQFDDMGNLVNNVEMTNSGDEGIAIDVDNINNEIGLAMFGNISNNTQDLFMTKTYYNGFSCNHSLLNVNNSLANGASFTDLSVNQNPLSLTKISLTNVTIEDINKHWLEFARNNLCNLNSVSGGSNAFDTPKEDKNKSLFYPNPFNYNESNSAQINVKVANKREIQVCIYDMLGREYYKENIFIEKDKSTLKLDLSNIDFVPGMYMIHLNDNGKYQTSTIQIK